MKQLLLAIGDFEATNIGSPIRTQTIELARAFSRKVWIRRSVIRASETSFNDDGKVLRRAPVGGSGHEHERLAQLAQTLRNRDVDTEAPGETPL